jgi:hypothetical protein
MSCTHEDFRAGIEVRLLGSKAFDHESTRCNLAVCKNQSCMSKVKKQLLTSSLSQYEKSKGSVNTKPLLRNLSTLTINTISVLLVTQYDAMILVDRSTS